MRITILNVTHEHVPNAKGGYGKLDVAYKNDGKTEGKKIMSFSNEAVFNTVREAKAGDMFDVVTEKDKNNYWQWASVTPVHGAAAAQEATVATKTTSGATTTPRSTYETPEERAKKQVYIVRQSSIANAIAYSQGVKALKTAEDVLKVAAQFEAFVFGEKYDDGTVFTMKDDADMVIR
jgi:hypothetical protein